VSHPFTAGIPRICYIPIGATKETVLEVNANKNAHVLLSRSQDIGQYHGMKRAYKFLKVVEQTTFLEKARANQNLLQEFTGK
jgi:hypothetical protein